MGWLMGWVIALFILLTIADGILLIRYLEDNEMVKKLTIANKDGRDEPPHDYIFYGEFAIAIKVEGKIKWLRNIEKDLKTEATLLFEAQNAD